MRRVIDYVKSFRPRNRAGHRLVPIDAARGAAMIGVVVYHFVWDLRYFELMQFPIENQLYWEIFQKILAGSFVMLVGASLVLAHGAGIRWPSFWRRFGLLVAAALATTIGTYVFWADAFVYFGVLHAIALFSLLGLAFLKLDRRLVAAIGLLVVLAPSVFQNPAFNARALSWIGFWQVPPLTSDLVPVFPWFGVTLLGMALMGWGEARLGRERIAAAGQGHGWLRPLALVGRWTLLIYLVHQLVLVGILEPVAFYLHSRPEVRDARFVRECVQSCEIGAGTAGFCAAYCQCSLEQIAGGDLWSAVQAETPTPAQSRSVSQVVNLCSAMARDEPAPSGDQP